METLAAHALEATLSFQRNTHNCPVVKFKNEPAKSPLQRFSVLQDTERPYVVVVSRPTPSGDVTYEGHGYPDLASARIAADLWQDARVPTTLWGSALDLPGNYQVVGIADSGTVPAVAGDLVTLYYRTEMLGSIVKQEGKLIRTGRAKYAQYPNAPFVEYVPKRKRNGLRKQGSYRPYILVLKGHGHPDPAALFGKKLPSTGGLEVTTTTYGTFSGDWIKDFEAKINPYLAAQPHNLVVADFREDLGAE